MNEGKETTARTAQDEQEQADAAKQERLRRRAAKAEKARAHAAKQEKRRAPAAKAERAPKEKGPERAAKATKGTSARRRLGRARKLARGRAKAVRRRWKYMRRSVRRFYNRRYRFTYRSTITRVPARDELPALLNARGLCGRGAEIGVKLGVYSDSLLTNWRGDELVSIDPWLSDDPDEYVDRSNVTQEEFDRYYQEACQRLARHGSRSSIWRMTSVEAAARVPDHSFDFVYIDARHDYESVKEDLEAWCSKVRPGGILAGHDYVDGDLPQGEFYVKSAVDEFFGARGIPVHSTEGPSAVEMFPTWIVEVPKDGVAATSAEQTREESITATVEKGGEHNGAPAVRAGEQSPAQ